MTFGEVIDGIGKSLGVELVDEGGAAAVQVDGNPIILHMAVARTFRPHGQRRQGAGTRC